MAPWLGTPPGRYLLAWEQQQLDRMVADIFGFHALQLGHPVLDGLGANRMPHRWLALDAQHAEVLALPLEFPTASADEPASTLPPFARTMHLGCDFDALPFPAASIDLVVLPHTLDFVRDPHQTLREVERVLVPEGRVVVMGFNPMSLWGVRQRLGLWRGRLGSEGAPFVPGVPEAIGPHRLRDWLRLLSFEVQDSQFGCWRPPLRSTRWLERARWMERPGERWWPMLGAAFSVTAIKRVRGMRLVGPALKLRPSPMPAPAVATNQVGQVQQKQESAT